MRTERQQGRCEDADGQAYGTVMEQSVLAHGLALWRSNSPFSFPPSSHPIKRVYNSGVESGIEAQRTA